MALDEMLARMLAGWDLKRQTVFREVIRRLIHNGRVTTTELASALNMPQRTVRRYTQDLVYRGVLNKTRRREERGWVWYYTWGSEIRYILDKLPKIVRRW